MRKCRPSAPPAASPRRRIALAERLEPRALLSAGDLDPTFGTGGKVTLDIPASAHEYAQAIVVQPDGRYVVAGSVAAVPGNSPDVAFGVARYQADGTLDSTFGHAGHVVISLGHRTEASAVALAPDGKIVVVGTTYGFETDTEGPEFAIARLNRDGSLDHSFDGDGRRTFDSTGTAEGVAVQTDGKMVVVGQIGEAGATVIRLNLDGSLDATFDGDGRLTGAIAGKLVRPNAVAIDAAGNIVGAGGIYTHITGEYYHSDFAVFRLRPDGSPDPTFDGDGVAAAPLWRYDNYANDLVIAPDGKIVTAGPAGGVATGSVFALARFNTDGTLDTGLGDGDGMVTIQTTPWVNACYALGVAPDGKIIVGGQGGPEGPSGGPLVLARLDGSGALDPTFDGDGKVLAHAAAETVRDLAILPDGKIIAVGSTETQLGKSDFRIARYTESGSPDISFGGSGVVTTDFVAMGPNDARAVVVQPDGKVIVGGRTPPSVAGNLPMGFDFVLARFNADGSPDSTFGRSGLVVATADDAHPILTDLALQDDGRIVVVGSTYNAGPDGYGYSILVGRFRPDGSLDPSFGEGGWKTLSFGTFIRHRYGPVVALQPDGKIVVGSSDGPDFALARLDPDGSLDVSFGGDGTVVTDMNGPDSFPSSPNYWGWDSVTNIVFGTGGTITVVGPTKLTADSSGDAIAVARYDWSGRLDTTFGDGGKRIYDVGGEGFYFRPIRAVAAPDGGLIFGTTGGGAVPILNRGFLLFRVSGSGDRDASFGPPGGDGTVRVEFGGGGGVLHDLLALPDGGVIAVGIHRREPYSSAHVDVAVARLTVGGALDPTFGVGGKVVSEFDAATPTEVLSAALAPNGRIVVAGTAIVPSRATDFAVARFLLTDGSPRPQVVGAHVFYNHAAPGHSDAPDKQPLLPGQNPSFQNITSYARGLTGVIVDVMNPYGVELTADDFAFRSAAGSARSGWSEGPRPASVTVERGAGAGGSDRVKIVWNDYDPRSGAPDQAVANGWLEVTVKPATPRLAGPFVFRFGNLVGETGEGPAAGGVTFAPRVDGRDFAATVAAQRRSYDDVFDFNCDGRVNMLDIAMTRSNFGRTLLTPTEALPRRRRGDYLALPD